MDDNFRQYSMQELLVNEHNKTFSQVVEAIINLRLLKKRINSLKKKDPLLKQYAKGLEQIKASIKTGTDRLKVIEQLSIERAEIEELSMKDDTSSKK